MKRLILRHILLLLALHFSLAALSATGESTPPPAVLDETPETPAPSPEPVKFYCDLLIDNTGIYLYATSSKYVAIKNVHECAFYAANNINENCNPKKLVTVLTPTHSLADPHELEVAPGNHISVLDDDEPKSFLCFSLTHGISIGVDKTRVVLVTPLSKKKSHWLEF